MIIKKPTGYLIKSFYLGYLKPHSNHTVSISYSVDHDAWQKVDYHGTYQVWKSKFGTLKAYADGTFGLTNEISVG